MRFKSINSYQIKEEKHHHFLLEDRNDPVTGDSFSEGDEVVFCSACKSAFLKDSWEYMGNKHCEQHFTLPIFPTSKKLTLQKPIELPFILVDSDQRSSAFLVDILILAAFCFVIVLITAKLRIYVNPSFYAILSFVLFMFRDSFLINRSIGKSLQHLYFIDVATNLPATIWQTLGRNLLYWVLNSVFALFFLSIKALDNQLENIALFYFFIGLIFVGMQLIYIKHNIKNNYSWFDKLLGIRLVKKK